MTSKYKSADLFETAKRVLVDGYARPIIMQPYPKFIDRGEGCWVWDVDGNKWLDCANNFTALIHGHCHPAIVSAVQEQMAKSACSAMPTDLEIKLASTIADRIPSIEKVRFCNTGTEAVMLSVKMARALTGRSKIAKTEGGYHGQYDLIEASFKPAPDAWGNPERPNTVAHAPGTPESLLRELLVMPCNDIASSRALISENAANLAAVIVCPTQVQMGFGQPSVEFLSMLREETQKYGILLIFDEVVSLRDGMGGRQGAIGVLPDITVMGKVIGGGLPIGAVGGPDSVMSLFKTEGDHTRLAHSSTFAANPITMAAGYESMQLLDEMQFKHLHTLTDLLCERMFSVIAAAGIKGRMEKYCGGAAKLILSDRVIHNYRDLHAYFEEVGMQNIGMLQQAFFEEGILAPRLSFILSTSMTENEIDIIVNTSRRAIAKYKNNLGTENRYFANW